MCELKNCPMRTKFVVIIFIALFSCSKEGADPVYTDITGSWTFKSDILAGDFSIIDSKSQYGLFVDNVGQFSIGTKVMSIKSKTQVTTMAFTIRNLNLYENTGSSDGDYININYADISSDYKTITITQYSYKSGATHTICNNTCGTIIMTRKK